MDFRNLWQKCYCYNSQSRCFNFPPHLTNASALYRKTSICKNCIFSLKWCIALSHFSQSLTTFIQCCYLQLILMLLNGPLNLVFSQINFWTVMRSQFGRKLTVLHCSNWTVLKPIRNSALSSWKSNLLSVVHLTASNICWNIKIFQQNCLLTVIHGLMKNNSHFWQSNQHHNRLRKCQNVST